jgi:protein arginine N-methyltransferase 1
MVLDRGRISAYAHALGSYIRPDSVVLDIGCGPGILSLLACQFGARKVYAVEPSDVIACARDAALKNAFADRIVFFQALSTAVTLPEKADIIVSDIRGVLPFFGVSISSLIDARERLLTPGGRMIPRRDSVWVALVEAADRYHQLVDPFLDNAYKLAFPDAAVKVTNAWEKAYFKPDQLVTPPACWCTLDYATVETPHARGTARWVLERPCAAHGLAMWFDCEMTDSNGYSNSPLGTEKHIYGQAFFPLAQPLELAAGDWVKVDLRADLTGENYVWGWTTAVGAGSATEPHRILRQSSFLGTLLSRDSLRKRAHSFVPDLNEQGEVDRLILGEMGTGSSLDQIARKLAERFPNRFASLNDALTHVGEISSRYSA